MNEMPSARNRSELNDIALVDFIADIECNNKKDAVADRRCITGQLDNRSDNSRSAGVSASLGNLNVAGA